MKIYKLIAPHTTGTIYQTKKMLQTKLHLIKGEVSARSTHLITSSTQQIRVITHYQRKIGPESSSVCPHLPTYLDTYTQTLGFEHHLALIFLCDIYTPISHSSKPSLPSLLVELDADQHSAEAASTLGPCHSGREEWCAFPCIPGLLSTRKGSEARRPRFPAHYASPSHSL